MTEKNLIHPRTSKASATYRPDPMPGGGLLSVGVRSPFTSLSRKVVNASLTPTYLRGAGCGCFASQGALRDPGLCCITASRLNAAPSTSTLGSRPPPLGLDRSHDLIDRFLTGRVPSGFDPRKGFLPDARQIGQSLLA